MHPAIFLSEENLQTSHILAAMPAPFPGKIGSEGSEYYAKKRREGKTHKEALVVLTRNEPQRGLCSDEEQQPQPPKLGKQG